METVKEVLAWVRKELENVIQGKVGVEKMGLTVLKTTVCVRVS